MWAVCNLPSKKRIAGGISSGFKTIPKAWPPKIQVLLYLGMGRRKWLLVTNVQMLEGCGTPLYLENDGADRSLWRGRGKRMVEERLGSRDG